MRAPLGGARGARAHLASCHRLVLLGCSRGTEPAIVAMLPAEMNGTLPRCLAIRTLAVEKEPEPPVTRTGTASQSRTIRRSIGWK